MTPQTKTPSVEALRAAEAVMTRVFDDCMTREGCSTKGMQSAVAAIIDNHTNLPGLLRVKEAARVFCAQVEQRDSAGADTGDMPIGPYNDLRAALEELEGK